MTTTAVSSSANPSILGNNVTFTATVSVNSPGAGTPTGVVTFRDGGVLLGTGNLSSGTASFATATPLIQGLHTITASYGGDTNDAASTSVTLSQIVGQASETVALTSSVNPSVAGQSVKFTATVSGVPAASGTPTGLVNFIDGSTSIGIGSLNGSGVATFTTTILAPGSHSITAIYSGDTNFKPGLSSAVVQVVNAAATAAAVSSLVNPAVFGQTVILNAEITTVAPGAGIPNGTILFKEGALTLGSGAVTLDSAGRASIAISNLAVGTHTVHVTYSGNTSFAASVSADLPQVVNAAGTSTAIVSSAAATVFGQSATFTANVTAMLPGVGARAGR